MKCNSENASYLHILTYCHVFHFMVFLLLFKYSESHLFPLWAKDVYKMLYYINVLIDSVFNFKHNYYYYNVNGDKWTVF